MKTHDDVIKTLMSRSGVKAEVERIEAERMKREAERWGLWADAIIGQIGESPPSKEDQP